MSRTQDIQRMLSDIRAHTRSSRDMTGRDSLDPRVLEALGRVPRELFVPVQLRHLAHADGPLPIGQGQTISQPFIVALMTDLVRPQPGSRILEVGTGCGYQTAVLAELAGRVFSIEILPELSRRAAERLNQLGYRNVETRVGDGYHGWVDQAPFDGILVTAAADEVPAPLVEQLAPGGRLVIPVGDTLFGQSLKLVERPVTGSVRIRDVLPVAFVPLTGVH